MRVKFRDLYKIYPGKWVVSYDDEWKNGRVESCVVHGVYETEDEGLEVLGQVLLEKSAGLSKAISEEEEDENNSTDARRRVCRFECGCSCFGVDGF
ncbi:MAG: hypothetical protein FWG65_09860 [Turicibacter sp.]|nr:hypothetical protein [Turicibacter sp.]